MFANPWIKKKTTECNKNLILDIYSCLGLGFCHENSKEERTDRFSGEVIFWSETDKKHSGKLIWKSLETFSPGNRAVKGSLCVLSWPLERSVSLERELCFPCSWFSDSNEAECTGCLTRFPPVLISGSPQQPRGLLTADVGCQLSLPSRLSFYALSPCSGNDRDPHQFQARLSQ